MPLRCVDASVVVAWFVPGQCSTSVVEVWSAYSRGEDQFVGPPFLYAETISAIRHLAFRGMILESEAVDMVADFLSLSRHDASSKGRRFSVSRFGPNIAWIQRLRTATQDVARH